MALENAVRAIRHGFPRLLQAAVNLVCPPLCPLCGVFLPPSSRSADGAPGFCPDCLADMAALPRAVCRVCGWPFPSGLEDEYTCGFCRKKPPPFLQARAAGLYEGSLRKAIHAFKFRKGMELARPLADLMRGRLEPPLYPPEADWIVPVPLHSRRLRERGFNQALVLARRVYGDWSERIRYDLLTRARWTDPQMRLKAPQRERNVAKAFGVTDPSAVRERRVLLLDDVYTTGSTMRECARTLTRAGAADVLVVTLARVR